MADVEIITNIDGLDALEETLTVGGKKAAVRFLRSIERRAAKLIQTEAEQTAPYETGNLEDNINISSRLRDDTLTCRIGPGGRAFYGIFSELGTEHEPALHWLSQAFDDALDALIEEASSDLEEMAQR